LIRITSSFGGYDDWFADRSFTKPGPRSFTVQDVASGRTLQFADQFISSIARTSNTAYAGLRRAAEQEELFFLDVERRDIDDNSIINADLRYI